MKHSIRTFLLVNLLLSVTVITSLAIALNLFLAHKDMKTQLDAQLIHTTLHLKAFFSAKTNLEQLAIIQKRLESKKRFIEELKAIPTLSLETIRQASRSLEFQIWDQHGKLLLHSNDAIKTPFSDSQPGLITRAIEGHLWRISTGYNKSNQLTIMVAERENFRQQLENQLTQDAILVMFITYPFLGFLIWNIVGRGLSTLQRVAREVHERAPSYLKPVAVESVPAEIEPLIQELNSLFSRLQDAFEREKRFTADAAHELKTPLAALSAQTQVALRATTDVDKKEALLKVLSGVQRSAHVVQQLLTLSRMEPDAGLTETVEICLAKRAADIMGLLAPEALEKHIDLELLSPNNKATIHGNATAIDILIRNLVDNAIRYSPENSCITISIQETPKQVILIVSDNGPGIPKALQKRVFERFYRVIGNKSTGSGLGLSIVQQIAKLHNAKIQLLTPSSGKGAEFRIIFPKQKSP